MHDEGRCFAALFAKNKPEEPFIQFANDPAFFLAGNDAGEWAGVI